MDDLLVLQLWSLLTAFERRLAAELQGFGLTVATFRLIGEVMLAPGGVRQGELARRLGVRPPTISAAVARLERDGLVHRERDPDDPRARLVMLTPDPPLLPGVELLQGMEDSLFAGLDDADRAAVRRVFTTLGERLAPPPSEAP